MNVPLKHRPFYCVKEVEHLTGRTRNPLYRWRKSGYLPPAVEFGPNSIGWFVAVINEWLASRPARLRGTKQPTPRSAAGSGAQIGA